MAVEPPYILLCGLDRTRKTESAAPGAVLDKDLEWVRAFGRVHDHPPINDVTSRGGHG